MTKLWRVLATVAALSSVVAGCASIPANSEVREVREAVGEARDLDVGVYALPPQPDAGPLEIVRGFLEASGAVNFEVASDYLAPDVEWTPSTVVVYDESGFDAEDPERPNRVNFEVTPTAELDERNAYQPVVGANKRTMTFTLTEGDDGWRISEPPDQLLISQTDFELQYNSYNRYFFEPSRSVLVPDPIYLRESDQDVLAARLIHSLLAGPTEWLAPAVKPLVPSTIQCATDPETCVADVGIEGGHATVALSSGGAGLNADQRRDLLAQVVWTLNEIDAVDEVLVVVDGLPISGQRRDIDAFPEVRPVGSGQSSPVRRAYVLVDGRLTNLVLDPEPRQSAFDTPFPADAPPISAFAVANTGSLLAAVLGDTQLYIFPEGASDPGKPVLTGERLVSPSWDRFGRLWVVDATADGSSVRMWDGKRTMRVVDVPGVDGSIRQLAISNDGTRAALVVERASGVVQVELRVVHRVGDTVELGNPRPLAPQLVDVKDVAWQDAETLVVLGSRSAPAAEGTPSDQARSPVQPFLVTVDGSVVVPQGIAAESSVSVAAAPNMPILVSTEQEQVFQYADGVWTNVGRGGSPGYPE